MDRFFTFLQNHRSGILLFLFVMLILVFLIQWLTWIFAKGRFKLPERLKTTGTGSGSGTGTGGGDGPNRTARFVFTEAATKIINEFRHLLALLLLVIFSFALAYSLIKAGSLTTGDAVNNMKGALEGVVATLGGLVGSIMGYYFGESSVVKTETKTATDTSGTPVQEGPKGDAAAEKKAPAPPIKKEQPSSDEGASTGSGSGP